VYSVVIIVTGGYHESKLQVDVNMNLEVILCDMSSSDIFSFREENCPFTHISVLLGNRLCDICVPLVEMTTFPIQTEQNLSLTFYRFLCSNSRDLLLLKCK
jgi:hypothetical protein